MNRLDRLLFPRSRVTNFIIIACGSAAISFLLTGRQIFQANWGMFDDHEIFQFLGPGLHLRLGDIWTTMMTQTEVGNLQGRFRPSYYFLKLVETSLWGPNVHLWYLTNTVCFAIFLSSLWWSLLRFVGGWLSFALTISIALLSLWAEVWSRLGPSEIDGAACVGIAIFAADFILFSNSPRTRNLNALVLTLATVVLIGLKETFLPLALGGVAVLWLAAWQGKLSRIVATVLSLVILGGIAGIAFVVSRQVGAGGTDTYGNPAGSGLAIKFGIIGILDAFARTCWLFVLPIILFQMLQLIPRKSIGEWISNSRGAIGVYGFLIVMYAAQCALYRSSFPRLSRYDFPAMLLVPLTCCILACEISKKTRPFFPERTIEYAQLTVAVFLFFALAVVNLGKPPLLAAVQANIKTTDLFFSEVQRVVVAAKEAPDKPIILEAYGPWAIEPVGSMVSYLSALGAKNPISVRFHRDENANGNFLDGLEKYLLDMQQNGSATFTPLEANLAHRDKGCLSLGIFGPSDTACTGFHMADLKW